MSKQTTINPAAVIILAAGLGTRMKSDLPKVLHSIAGQPMIKHLIASAEKIGPERIVVVSAVANEDVQSIVAPHPIAIQAEQLGTGHAVLSTAKQMAGFKGDVLILFGGDPLITPKTMNQLLERRRQADSPSVVVLGFQPTDPGLYGRLIFDNENNLTKIVEAHDASREQLSLGMCNAGVMAVDSTQLFNLLNSIGNDNVKGEYYLTDIVAIANRTGEKCTYIEATDPNELTGVDTRADLANVEAIVQDRLRRAAMAEGVTLIDPGTVFFSFDTKLGRDVIIEPNVVFAPGVNIGNNVTIRAFSHIAGTSVANGVTIGPFARLRPGTQVGKNVNIGNFVEIKNATLEESAKVNHLSYVGDAWVGSAVNLGAGTITCNYDGFQKYRTKIGAGAFIGSNTALVAPVSVGDGAIIGAGSIISKDVEPNALAVSRAPQKQRAEWAKKLRAKKSAEKSNPKAQLK